MQSFKTLIIAACLLLATSATASAGHQADYTMTMSMGDAFGEMAGMFGEMPEGAEAPAEMPEQMTVLKGKVYWMDGFSRVDMFYDPEMPEMQPTTGLKPGDLVESFIIFEESGTSYQLIHADKLAVMMDGSMPEGMGGDSLPDLQPDRMISSYEDMIAELQSTEGMEIMELAPKVINGVPVKGISFIMDMQAMIDSMGEMEGMPDMSGLFEMEGSEAGDGSGMEGMEGMEDLGGLLAGIMAMMGDISGEMWFSEELDVMMSMDMSLMGINTTMELDSVFNWEDDGSTFVVPDDYEVITQQDYMQQQMDELDELMKGYETGEGAEYYDPMKDGAKISES